MKGVKLGPTGRYPRGRVDLTDEGELRLAIAADHAQGIVRVMFGKPVVWIGLPIAEAREFAQVLLQKVDELECRQQ